MPLFGIKNEKYGREKNTLSTISDRKEKQWSVFMVLEKRLINKPVECHNLEEGIEGENKRKLWMRDSKSVHNSAYET